MSETNPISENTIRQFVSCITKKPLSSGRAQELVRTLSYRAYKCEYCEYWHVAKTPFTKQPKPGKRKRQNLRKRKGRGRKR